MASPTVAYSSLIIPFVLAGIGMALVFAPVSNMILSSVARSDEGKASGANNAIREIGGTLGVAVLASVFSREGSTLTGQGFVDGLVPRSGSEPSCSPAGRCSPWQCRAGAPRGPSSRRPLRPPAASPNWRSISAHREHERRARVPGQAGDAGAQRELAGVHDGERGGEAARGVDAHPADAAPAGRP